MKPIKTPVEKREWDERGVGVGGSNFRRYGGEERWP